MSSISPWRWDWSFHDARLPQLLRIVVEDAPASNGPIRGAITKRYLQQRSVIFRSSGEILAAIGGSTITAKEQPIALCNGIKQGLAAAVFSNSHP
jgi:hypothetical protein